MSELPKFLEDILLILFIKNQQNVDITVIRKNFKINENTLQQKLRRFVDNDVLKRSRVRNQRLGGPKYEYFIGEEGEKYLNYIKEQLCKK